jgi:hypothetical protein
VEIPFGHHRKAAWEQCMGAEDEIEINILSLSDTSMLKMMAHENMEEWGTTAIVEIETVAAVVKAYAEGKIELNGVPATTEKAVIRYAPSFIVGKRSPQRGELPYVTQSIANFLGWIQTTGRPQTKVYTALSALELIEKGIVIEDDFLELTSKQAEALVSETKNREDEREREARELEEKAKEAEGRAAKASTNQARKVAEDQAHSVKEKAARTRAKGKEEATRVGKHLSKGMREGRIATKAAKTEAEKIVGIPKQERELRKLNTFVRQMITDLDSIFSGDKRSEKLRQLVIAAAEIDYGVRDALIGSLEGVADRALEFARKFKSVEERQVKPAKNPTINLLKDA